MYFRSILDIDASWRL